MAKVHIVRKQNRKDLRRPLALHGMAGGHRFEVTDLSMGGFGALFSDPQIRDFEIPSKMRVQISDSPDFSFFYKNLAEGNAVDLSAIVVRKIKDGAYGFRFFQLQDNQYDFIENRMMGRYFRIKRPNPEQ